MIDKEGNVRIMDFGIARSLKAKGITGTGLIIGTPEYMSPEQAEMEAVDQRSDIYSLGVILYEMVTGRVPFEGETPLSVAMKHKSESPPDPREINAQVPEVLSRVILKCLEKKKERRHQNSEELLAELKKIEKELPTTERLVPKRKPITEKEITVQLKLKKLLIPAFALISLVILAIVLWRFLPREKAVPFPQDKPSLAVMFFENNTGEEGFDHWRKALSDLLIADLSQSKYIRVLSGEKLFNILEELDMLEARSYSSRVLKELSNRGGVQYVLVGKLAMAGNTLRINALLQDASTGELIGSEMVEGVGEESLFSMVDELTRKVKTNFKLSASEIAADIDREVENITTTSSEAYKYYREGRDYFSKGDYLKSIPLFEVAVAMDPEFAMAYRSLASAYSNIGYRTEAMKRYQKAFELSDQVSERERYHIQGTFYFQSEKTYSKVIKIYDELLKLYPDDSIGNVNLGALYLYLEEWEKAKPFFELDIRNKDKSIISYQDLADNYAAMGLYERARQVLELYLSSISENATIRFNLAYHYLYQRKYDLALDEAEKASSLSPDHYNNFLVKGDILHCQGDLLNAEREYQKLLETDEPKAHEEGIKRLAALYLLQGSFVKSKDLARRGIELGELLGETEWMSWFHSYSAYLHLKSKNLKEALRECDEAWNIAEEAGIVNNQREALYLKGRVYAEMKLMDEAQRTATELKRLIDEGVKRKAVRYYDHLMGIIELERANFSTAIDYFEQALNLLPYQMYPEYGQALFFEPLALAHYKAGDMEKAQKEYERIISLTTGRLLYGDIYARSLYMLGDIYEKRALKGKAKEQYQRFINLWKNADPGLPEIEDARKRL